MVMARGVSLAWLESREDFVARLRGLCSNGGERERVDNGGREREMHPFSRAFDRGVFPTGVKKGRADWAE